MENFQSVSKSIKVHLIPFLCNNSDHIWSEVTMSHALLFFNMKLHFSNDWHRTLSFAYVEQLMRSACCIL